MRSPGIQSTTSTRTDHDIAGRLVAGGFSSSHRTSPRGHGQAFRGVLRPLVISQPVGTYRWSLRNRSAEDEARFQVGPGTSEPGLTTSPRVRNQLRGVPRAPGTQLDAVDQPPRREGPWGSSRNTVKRIREQPSREQHRENTPHLAQHRGQLAGGRRFLRTGRKRSTSASVSALTASSSGLLLVLLRDAHFRDRVTGVRSTSELHPHELSGVPASSGRTSSLSAIGSGLRRPPAEPDPLVHQPGR